jgi:hypothetical protein
MRYCLAEVRGELTRVGSLKGVTLVTLAPVGRLVGSRVKFESVSNYDTLAALVGEAPPNCSDCTVMGAVYCRL